MITFPCAKINLGLNIVGVRDNGYHNIETVFYPIPLCDALEITHMHELFPSETACDLKITGNEIIGKETNNLVVKAYNLLKKDYSLPRIHIHLFKKIPSQAGLGGGSSDAAYTIRLLNEKFNLNMDTNTMIHYASKLGADCAFFINAVPAFASGIGDVLEPLHKQKHALKGFYLFLIKPDIAISTQEAYQQIEIKKPQVSCKETIALPIEHWKNYLSNDFESYAFKLYPQLKNIKDKLYQHGAIYASMSGSGSTIYGIFNKKPTSLQQEFNDCFTTLFLLS